jgi:hypothetical protein
MSIYDLLDSLESEEHKFLETEFLAPVLPGGQVRVRIAGLVCTLRVSGEFEPGWAILKPQSMDRARVVSRPSLQQVRDYLALFPAVRLLLVSRASRAPSTGSGQAWLAIPAHRGDRRFEIEGPVRIHLVAGAEPFQRIIARFDGTLFWFQEVDRRRSPAIAAYLREELDAGTRPQDLHKPTLTAEEREAYRLVQQAAEALQRDRAQQQRTHVRTQRSAEVIQRDPAKERLAGALAHAGAELTSYIEQGDAYTVAFVVDGQARRTIVSKGDLTVLSAGICLSGQDQRFDLQSLVGVLREGSRLR